MTKTVFITGGATGIGQACVQKFHAMGWNTAFMDINTEAGQATAAPLSGVRFYPGDVKNKEQIAGATKKHAAFAQRKAAYMKQTTATRHQATQPPEPPAPLPTGTFRPSCVTRCVKTAGNRSIRRHAHH